jgi:hypothetical protein
LLLKIFELFPINLNELKRLIAYTLLFLLVQTSFIAQEKKMLPPEIKKALLEGNSKLLAEHFNQSVELLIKNKEDVYSKAQAELILKDFFKKNTPNNFIIEAEGESNGIKYVIGNLKTRSGKFKVYLSYQKKQWTPHHQPTEYQ